MAENPLHAQNDPNPEPVKPENEHFSFKGEIPDRIELLKIVQEAGGVLLIWPLGSKGGPALGPDGIQKKSLFDRYNPGWGKRTFADTQTPEYQADLKSGKCNIGLRQGAAGGNIVGIDFDCNESWVVEEFLALNPFARDTLITRGAIGCTIWLKLEGYYPPKHASMLVPGATGKKDKNGKLKKGTVEWRPGTEGGIAGSGHSVIYGLHPEGMPYTVLGGLKAIKKVRYD